MAHCSAALTAGPHFNYALVPTAMAELAWEELALAQQYADKAYLLSPLIEALSIGIAAQRKDPSSSLQVFTVRKAAKEHGRQKRIEGNFSPGNSVVVVDDVITTGGSTIQAIDAIEEAGGQIAFVIVLVDREEGGRENIEKRGYKVIPIFTRADLSAQREQGASHKVHKEH